MAICLVPRSVPYRLKRKGRRISPVRYVEDSIFVGFFGRKWKLYIFGNFRAYWIWKPMFTFFPSTLWRPSWIFKMAANFVWMKYKNLHKTKTIACRKLILMSISMFLHPKNPIKIQVTFFYHYFLPKSKMAAVFYIKILKLLWNENYCT